MRLGVRVSYPAPIKHINQRTKHMVYDAEQDAMEIAKTIRMYDITTIDYLAKCLKVAYKHGEVDQLSEMTKHIGDNDEGWKHIDFK